MKVLSAVLIFCGVYLVTRSKAKPEGIKGPLDEWEGEAQGGEKGDALRQNP